METELEKNGNNSVLEHGKLIKVFSLLAALCIVIFYVGRGLTDKLAGPLATMGTSRAVWAGRVSIASA